MGQKVNPIILRIGYLTNWRSNWFAPKSNFANFVIEDTKIRKIIREKYRHAAVSNVFIERLADKLRIKILTARPGVIIGRHGAEIESIKKELGKITKDKELAIDIQEVKEPFLDANLVAENIAFQVEKRVVYRRAIKRAIEQTMNQGAQGIKVTISGRLSGAEIKRSETYKQGKIPLQTLRADIDYAAKEAFTTYGLIGIKVWIYKGDVIKEKQAPKQAINITAEQNPKEK